MELIIKLCWWDFKSVLTEELIFRGALLYILIHKIGASKSVLLSAIAFGVYHWFSYGVLGNVMGMVVVLITTGLMGYAWAWAFSKTNSIFLPLGLHLGWNVLYNTVFSQGPLGTGLLVTKGGHDLTGVTSLVIFISDFVIVPLLLLLYVRYFIQNEQQAIAIDCRYSTSC